VRDLLRESRVFVRKVRENLAWAFGYNSVLVPLAAGMLYPTVYISPPYAALVGWYAVPSSLHKPALRRPGNVHEQRHSVPVVHGPCLSPWAKSYWVKS